MKENGDANRAAGSDLSSKGRRAIVLAALLALFLGAMDALVVSAAMPSIVADLGGLHLYAWVYSAYFLARAISLPIVGKLADLYPTRGLFLFSITLFLVSSMAAGASESMAFLVAARVVQGIGAGGNFALVYIVLSEVSLPGRRAQTLSLASSIWGIASLVGPTFGGFVVTYASWRWIFYVNVPLGILSLAGIGLYLTEIREKQASVSLDLAGAALLSGCILGLLILVITGGREIPWGSPWMGLLTAGTLALAVGFVRVERRAPEPILNVAFFRHPRFALGNGAVFFSSFAIFSLFAYAPLFIQASLGKTPMEVGVAMLALSLGWSAGSLVLGRYLHSLGAKKAAIAGGMMMLAGSCLTLGFDPGTTMVVCVMVFFLVGLGMGFVTLSTLLLVQSSVTDRDLGVATSFHQFSRTLGGTLGVGVCGGLVTSRLLNRLEGMAAALPADVFKAAETSIENLLRPEVREMLDAHGAALLSSAVARSLAAAFWVAVAASVGCLFCVFFLKKES